MKSILLAIFALEFVWPAGASQMSETPPGITQLTYFGIALENERYDCDLDGGLVSAQPFYQAERGYIGCYLKCRNGLPAASRKIDKNTCLKLDRRAPV